MKPLVILFAVLFCLSESSESSGRKVLIEIFTNSHCPLCPQAHNTLNSYLQNGANKDNVNFIYYHMSFPYPDDQLNQYNTSQSAARNNFYGPFSSTPRGIFSGLLQNNNYANWAGVIDNLANQESPFEINITGVRNGDLLNLKADILQTSAVTLNNPVIYFTVVENVNYQGRNGISLHKNVMRRIFPSTDGREFSPILNQTVSVEQNAEIDPVWNLPETGFVVFIQDKSSKTVYQSEFKTFTELVTTDFKSHNETLPVEFYLEQNYPNPFNPDTKIKFAILREGHVRLRVFSITGSQVAELINENMNSGSYEVNFNASGFTSGIYIYAIETNGITRGRKMTLLK